MNNYKKLQLDKDQYIMHFSIVGILMLIPIFLFGTLQKTNNGYRTNSEILLISFFFIIPAIVAFLIQLHRLKFRIFKVNIEDNELEEAIDRTVRELDWKVEKHDASFLRAYRFSEGGSEKSEMITIVRTDEGLLFNSIGNPRDLISILSIGKNKRNKVVFIKNLFDVINNRPKQIITNLNTDTTIKKILFRIFAYPLCLLVIIGCLNIVIYPETPRLLIGGVFGIIIISIWLYVDIRIMLKERSQNKKQ